MNIPDKADFQPSAQTLKKWLATRKPDMTIAGVNVLGFLGDAGNSSDTSWFWVAVMGEVAGLVATVYGGVRGGGEFLVVAILGVLMFIFCDFFFASKLHRNEAKKCILGTKILLSDDVNTAERGKLVGEIAGGKAIDMVMQALIIVIALLKVVVIALLGVFNNPFLYIPFLIIFLIVAYVHIRHTGFYFAYVFTQKAINKEHKQFTQGAFKAKEYEEMVETPLALRKFPIKHNPHEIVPNAEKNGNHYIIRAKGVLTDNDIHSLITGQEDANKLALFKACRKLQLENLESQSNT